MRPMPRPSWRMYSTTPRPSASIWRMAAASCSPQSHRREPNTSPVRHSEWTRHSTFRPSPRSPFTRATWCSPVRSFT